MGKSGLPFLPSELLEFINAYLLVIYVSMALIVALYIRRTLRNTSQPTWRSLLTWPELKFAMSIFLLVAGDAMIRGPVWWWRHVVNHGGDGAPLYSSTLYVTTVGMVICAWGGVCAIRVMSPKRWRQWPWVMAVTAGAAFALYFTF